MLKIAERWYSRKKISDDITLIFEPHVHPFLRCNIWHIKGRERDLLIDTGLGVASLKSAIEDLIDKPLTAVATHIHYDHVGCLHEFEHKVMHRIEAPRMPDYREHCPLKISEFPSAFHDMLRIDSDGKYLISARPDEAFLIDDYSVTGTTATLEVDEGDVLDLGDRHFEILHLPGHSPGSLGLYEARTGIFFSGDALYDGLLLDELEDSDIADYIGTMKRLRELKVSAVHGGHEPSFGQARMVELIDAYLAWRDI